MQLSNYSISLPHGETDTFERRTTKAQFISFVDRSLPPKDSAVVAEIFGLSVSAVYFVYSRHAVLQLIRVSGGMV